MERKWGTPNRDRRYANSWLWRVTWHEGKDLRHNPWDEQIEIAPFGRYQSENGFLLRQRSMVKEFSTLADKG